MMLRIPYESDDFPVTLGITARGHLSVTWNDILWAAMTVGRPNRHYVFRHGESSVYEALFRLSLVRSAIEQSSPRARRLRRTNAFKTLDPTEKGAVNYFLGMTFCKLFAWKLLNAPWLMHIDVFGNALGAVLRSRSRPDLVGEDAGGQWHAFECKGRSVRPDRASKNKAKAQAQRLVSVNGQSCQLHIGSFTYFNGDTLQFFWRDPPANGKAIELEHEVSWEYYYRPFIEAYNAYGSNSISENELSFANIKGSDISIGLHPEIAGILQQENWAKAHWVAQELSSVFSEEGYQPDGLRVKAGPSWAKPFETTNFG